MTRRLVGWLGELLITAGVVVLLFVAWQLWWTDVTANRAQDQLVQVLGDDFRGGGDGTATVGHDAFPELGSATAFAIIRVPRFGADYARPVIEGVERPVLELGVGHYPGTAEPGAVGNFAVAGHRTTYGRPFHEIDALRDGDRVIVETASDGVRLRGDRPRDRPAVADRGHRAGARPAGRGAERPAADDDLVPPEVQRAVPVRDARPARRGRAAGAVAARRLVDGEGVAVYAALWRVLPGPRWAKALQCLVLLVAVVAVLFLWVFPAVAGLVPFNDNTVGP